MGLVVGFSLARDRFTLRVCSLISKYRHIENSSRPWCLTHELRLSLSSFLRSLFSRWRCGRLGGHHAAIDDVLQLVRKRRARQRHLQRDLFLVIKRGQRLVEGLHSEPILTGLHG